MAPPLPKPTKIPRWADTGTRVEPAEAKKDSGWVAPELPPDTFFNWLQGISGDWLKWINERMFDGGSPTTFKVQTPNADAIADQGAGTLNLETGESRGTGAGFISMKVAEPGAAGLGINAPVEYIFFSGTSQTIRIKKNTSIAEGLNVGVEGTVVEDQIQVAYTDFIIDGSVFGVPQIRFDADDLLLYNRGANQYRFQIGAATDVFIITSDGAAIPGGLDVGLSGDPVENRIRIADSNFALDFSVADNPKLFFNFADNDVLIYDRATDIYKFQIGGLNKLTLDTSGATIEAGGLDVGFLSTPVEDQIRVADANFVIDGAAANPTIVFDNVAGNRDVFRFIRNVTPSNRAYEFLFDGTIHVQLTPGSFRPEASLSPKPDLGGSAAGNRWNDVWADSGIFTENIQLPASATDVAKRSLQNNIVARGRIASGAGAPVGEHFNVISAIKGGGGPGIYLINLAVDISGDVTILVTPEGTIARMTSASIVDANTIRVDIYNSAGSPVDDDFYFALIGRPNVIP